MGVTLEQLEKIKIKGSLSFQGLQFTLRLTKHSPTDSGQLCLVALESGFSVYESLNSQESRCGPTTQKHRKNELIIHWILHPLDKHCNVELCWFKVFGTVAFVGGMGYKVQK